LQLKERRFFLLRLLIYAIPLAKELLTNKDDLANYNVIAVPTLLVLFILLEVLIRWKPSIASAEVYDDATMIESYLNNARLNVVEIINSISSSKISESDIRANIMLVVRHQYPLSRKYMQIFYYVGGYGEEEQHMEWFKRGNGRGTCGEAWKRKHPVQFDSQLREYNPPAARLSNRQKAVPEIMSINSVLSVPLKERGSPRILGVLNFDSKLNVDRTCFINEQVIEQGVEEGKVLLRLLPNAEVKL
jgi:hypothetical protein